MVGTIEDAIEKAKQPETYIMTPSKKVLEQETIFWLFVMKMAKQVFWINISQQF